MRIKDWDKFQHYKHRCPPWIKLYRSLLDDKDWHALSGDAIKLLAGCWLIASENDGELPSLEKISFRMRMPEKKVRDLIPQLNHWLEHDASNVLAPRLQHATPEREGERETEKINKRATLCHEDWEPSSSTMAWASKNGFSESAVVAAVEHMKDWSRSGAKLKHDWDATLKNWLRGQGKSGSSPRKGDRASRVEAAFAELKGMRKDGSSDRGICGETNQLPNSLLPAKRT